MDWKPSDSSVLSPSTKVSRGECIHSYEGFLIWGHVKRVGGS